MSAARSAFSTNCRRFYGVTQTRHLWRGAKVEIVLTLILPVCSRRPARREKRTDEGTFPQNSKKGQGKVGRNLQAASAFEVRKRCATLTRPEFITGIHAFGQKTNALNLFAAEPQSGCAKASNFCHRRKKAGAFRRRGLEL